MSESPSNIESPKKRRYTDVMGGYLPALERCLIRHRVLQSYLLLYHGEELKNDLFKYAEDVPGWTDYENERIRRLRGARDTGLKKRKAAIRFLSEKGLLTHNEALRIPRLINHRNDIAHQLEDLNLDISPSRWAKDAVDFGLQPIEFDHDALNEVKSVRRALSIRAWDKLSVLTMSFRGLSFSPIEEFISRDIKRLELRIRKLVKDRKAEITRLNAEMSLEGSELTETLHPQWVENKNDRGQLTPRGAEICYQLFDLGKSNIAVAHLMKLTLGSVRSRYKKWLDLGGANRPPVEIPPSKYESSFRTKPRS